MLEKATIRVLCYRKEIVYVFCRLGESFYQNAEESVGMGDMDERNAGCLNFTSEESVCGSEDKSQSGL